jgi:hypothetical protein
MRWRLGGSVAANFQQRFGETKDKLGLLRAIHYFLTFHSTRLLWRR